MPARKNAVPTHEYTNGLYTTSLCWGDEPVRKHAQNVCAFGPSRFFIFGSFNPVPLQHDTLANIWRVAR